MKRLLVVFALFFAMSVGSFIALPSSASAAVAAGCDGSVSFLGLPTWYKYLDIGPEGADPCAITGPKGADGQINWEAAVPRIAIAVVEVLLRISALVAVGFVIYGGFRYITSQGEPDNARSARQTIIDALIGLVISLLATGIVAFVGNQLSINLGSSNIAQQHTVGESS